MNPYESIGLNQYLQPINAPVSDQKYVSPFDFDSETERGSINHSSVLVNAIDNAKVRNSYRAYNAVVSLIPGDGDYVDLQLAIDALRDANVGGIILLRPGTYYPEAPIVLYDNISIIGVDPTTCIIDCEDMGDASAGCIQLIGTFVTGDGTVTMTNGDATVTGSSSQFSTDGVVAGNALYVKGVKYTVLSVASDTSLELTEVYRGVTQAGLAYSIEDSIENVNITGITVKDGNDASTSGDGIFVERASNCKIENCLAYNNDRGMFFSGYDIKAINNECNHNAEHGMGIGNSLSCNYINNVCFGNVGAGYHITANRFDNTFSVEGAIANSNGTYGIYVDGSRHGTFGKCVAISNTSHGIYLTGSVYNVITGCMARSNGADGLHLTNKIGNNSELNIVSACNLSDNADDGIELTSGSASNIVATCVIQNNSGTNIVDNGTGNDTFNNL